jgi:hypothetical protein
MDDLRERILPLTPALAPARVTWSPVAWLDGASNVHARFVYGTRVNVPEYMVTAEGTFCILTDHLGSPRLVVNASTGAVAQRVDYDEWGGRARRLGTGLPAVRVRGRALRPRHGAGAVRGEGLRRPLLVANPYARELTFQDDRTRTRRDHVKYLTLIRTIALLHQHQRPVKTVSHRGQAVEYVEVTLEDLALANVLAHQVLGRSLDELPPQTRRALLALDGMVTEACAREGVVRSAYRFTRRALRERTGLGHTQLKVHLGRLEELEYVIAHAGGRGQSVQCELVYDGKGKDGAPFLTGLIDVEKLGGCGYDDGRWSAFSRGWSGQERARSGGGRPAVGPGPAGGRGGGIAISSSDDGPRSSVAVASPGNAPLGSEAARPSSYPRSSQANGALAAGP